MNRLAPANLASIIMGTWFFAAASGNFAAGLIAKATGGEGSLEASKEIVAGSPEAIAYIENVNSVYTTIGWVAVAVGVVLILLSPLIKKLMHLDTLGDADHSLAGQSELAEPQAAGMDTSGESIDI